MPDGRTLFQRYAFAIAAPVIAFLIRMALDPYLLHSPNKHIFTGFIIALILVTWHAGFIPSLITLVLGFLLADYFFLDPRYSFGNSQGYLPSLGPPAFIGIIIILFGRSMHLARAIANDHAREAIDNQRKLEQEVGERKRAEEEVRRLNIELEKRVEQRTAELVVINQELESFTYSVSHDLRAPLRHIDGYAQILEQEFGPTLSPDARTFTAKIRKGSQNMGRLVDDLLKLSHVGKKDLAKQSVNLKTLVDVALAEIQLEARNRTIQWQIGELPTVDCDSGLIQQVFINLLSNAAKYSRTREIAVIEVGQMKTNGEACVFVRDNGVGFNMKYSGKLFGVFQRLHRSEEFEGTGVGLATVARIIRKHEGRIWAEAELNKGATFYFTLGSSPSANGSGKANGTVQ